jgi:predicted amidohydrolase YtcJ
VLAGYTRGRKVAPGQPADLVLLHTDLTSALDALDAGVVRRTWVAGR